MNLSITAVKPLRQTPAHLLRPLSTCAISQTLSLTSPNSFQNGHPTRLQTRSAHTRRNVSSAAISVDDQLALTEPVANVPLPSSLSCLPFSTLLRSYVITAVSSYPALLRPALATLSFIVRSKSPLLDPDTSPILRALLKRTFYAQFCAGETPAEVQQTLSSLQSIGYKGVIVAHAKEVVLSKEDAAGLDAAKDSPEQVARNAKDIEQWRHNLIDTIQLARQDDFVALKFTGAGRQALQHLKANIPCAPVFRDAVHDICRAAEAKGVKLLFDAEQADLQDGIDRWTIYFAKNYNRGDKALVYGTYQAYAKRTPGLLAQHLDMAQKDNFVLGVKLVRGAYLGSDERSLFWPSIEGTHACYNQIAESIMRRRYGGLLEPTPGTSGVFPRVDMVLASHNAESVRLAMQIRDAQALNGEPRIELAYGQLMGMADNVSCEIVQAARCRSKNGDANTEIPQAYKYLVWGRMSECMKYLLRRAQENKDAVSRTIDARQALGRELLRRFGMSN